jgi:hypothetical protein
MANTKISQLPSYTGSAADLRWFVMNNSGETETFKYSGYTSPFKTGSVNNSATLNGYASSNAGRAGVLAGGSSNSYSNTPNSIVWGEQCWVGDDQQYPSAVFGRFCRSTGSGNLVAGNNSAAAGVYSVVIGEGNSCDTIWGSVFGRSCSIDGGSYMSIVAGNICSIQNSYAAAVFGEQNSINGSQHSAVLGGKLNSITSSSPYNAIVGSNNSSITGGTNVVMIGCSGRTATASQTTYVENLHTYRTPSTQVQPVFSGTVFTCNLDLGAKSQFYITGTSTINITNVRDGASFMIKTQTDGNYNMTWTATGGYTFVFEGGIKDPGNNVTDIFVFEVFGSVIYGNRRHNYS